MNHILLFRASEASANKELYYFKFQLFQISSLTLKFENPKIGTVF
ncbi:MAG: hypothetical protein U5L45_08070 [Saprospiraceae bacterium]|nr:hypothetical protein [Saprospiraceae bacterium]